MKRYIRFIVMFIIIGLIGSAWHFIYDWTGEKDFLKFLFPTNESIFEHLKMFFFPVMLVSLVESIFIYDRKDLFLTSRLYGSLFSIIGCIAFYYVYKTNATVIKDAVFITSYYVFLLLGLFVSYNIYRYMRDIPNYLIWVAFGIGILLTIVFIIYSYKPLNNEFFILLENK